jgi:putative oxidoreductase
MKRIFPDYIKGTPAIGLLIVRLVFGCGIMLHGWYKIQSPGGPFHWMGADAPVPAFLQGVSVLAEFGGGLAVLVGLLTPLAALGIVCNMIVAIGMVHLPQGDPFVARGPGSSFEPGAGYLAVALLLLLAGPGSISLDAWLWPRTPWWRRMVR